MIYFSHPVNPEMTRRVPLPLINDIIPIVAMTKRLTSLEKARRIEKRHPRATTALLSSEWQRYLSDTNNQQQSRELVKRLLNDDDPDEIAVERGVRSSALLVRFNQILATIECKIRRERE